MSVKTLVRFDPGRPKAVGECDRCGHIYRRIDLSKQLAYAGASVIDTGLRVCRDCLDPLDPQQKVKVPLPDGFPIYDPRPINHTVAAKYDWTVKPQPGWVQWRGPAPVAQSLVSSGVGSLAWSGHAPLTLLSVMPGAGALVWGGHAPSTLLDTRASPDVGALSWSGPAPVAQYQVAPSTANLSWTGHAPAVLLSVQSGAGLLTWSGPSPTAVFSAQPGVGAATWSGPAPTISNIDVAMIGFEAYGALAYGAGTYRRN